MADPINVLLVGGGGREHAIAASLVRSDSLGELFISNPENPGLAALGTPVDCPVTAKEAYRAVQFCEKRRIGLVIVGPEEPLADGLADKLRTPTRRVFGPGAEGARLEADKAWAKQLMRAASIPTAEARIFTDPEGAKNYVLTREAPHVIKASGLAKGKGVFLPDSSAQAVDAIDRIMVEKIFGDAGATVVVEERLMGPEVSVFALVDGRNIYILESAQDHKRLLDGDKGPNTGGMGAFCPTPLVTDALMDRIQREILVPTVDALKRDGIDYCGVLYAGLMVTHAGPKVLEFNVRFGDPECQAMLPRLETDLLDVLLATCDGRLDQIDLAWSATASCCVVLASEGYPEKPRTGVPISGIEAAEDLPGVEVFHAGTKRDDQGRIVTGGGRVLNVVAQGRDLDEARRRAYEACDLIDFPGKQFRRDIGAAAATMAPARAAR